VLQSLPLDARLQNNASPLKVQRHRKNEPTGAVKEEQPKDLQNFLFATLKIKFLWSHHGKIMADCGLDTVG
jgi:hypothetical protein